jgi:shikimate 5-dehydrogenase
MLAGIGRCSFLAIDHDDAVARKGNTEGRNRMKLRVYSMDKAILRSVIDPKGKALVLFGAGGAARAIAVEAALAGTASITVVNRDPKRGAELVALLLQKMQARAALVIWDRTYRVPEACDIVVNDIGGTLPQCRSPARLRC